jgi:hypothetical protein
MRIWNQPTLLEELEDGGLDLVYQQDLQLIFFGELAQTVWLIGAEQQIWL